MLLLLGGLRVHSVGLNRAQWLTERFVGAGEAQQQFVSMHRNRSELHHAFDHKPEPVFVQRNYVSRGQVQAISVLKTGVQKEELYFSDFDSAGVSTEPTDDSLPSNVWSETSHTQTKSPLSNQ